MLLSYQIVLLLFAAVVLVVVWSLQNVFLFAAVVFF
jgi:hypothetical protein